MKRTLNIKKKPYELLLLTGLLVLCISFFDPERNQTIDIHLHDTYYVIANAHIFWLLAMLSFFIWVIYLLSNRILYSAFLTWIHVLVCVFTVMLLAAVGFFKDAVVPSNGIAYSGLGTWKSLSNNYKTNTVAFALICFLLAQVVFVINFLIGIFKRKI